MRPGLSQHFRPLILHVYVLASYTVLVPLFFVGGGERYYAYTKKFGPLLWRSFYLNLRAWPSKYAFQANFGEFVNHI